MLEKQKLEWFCTEDSFRQFGIYYKLRSGSVCMQMWRGSEKELCTGRESFSFIIIYKVSEWHKYGIWWLETHWTCVSRGSSSTMCHYHVQVLSSSSWLWEFITIVEGVCNLTSVGCGCLLLHTRKTFVPSFLVPWAKLPHLGEGNKDPLRCHTVSVWEARKTERGWDRKWQCMSQNCQSLGGIWTMLLIICLNFWSALNRSGCCTRWSL